MTRVSDDPVLALLLRSCGVELGDDEQDTELADVLADIAGEPKADSRLIYKQREGGRSIHTPETLEIERNKRR